MRRGHKIAWGAIAVLLLAGCGREVTPEEQALQDERDIAQVEKANDAMGPLKPITPEPILYQDIERYDLFGEACNYAPGTSLGARVVAREADAFMKIDGEIVRFAADPGSRELPQRTRSLYAARSYSLRLQLDGEGEQSAEGTLDYEGSVTVFDSHGRVIYEGTGIAQCRG
jgi:hypothetical protein